MPCSFNSTDRVSGGCFGCVKASGEDDSHNLIGNGQARQHLEQPVFTKLVHSVGFRATTPGGRSKRGSSLQTQQGIAPDKALVAGMPAAITLEKRIFVFDSSVGNTRVRINIEGNRGSTVA